MNIEFNFDYDKNYVHTQYVMWYFTNLSSSTNNDITLFM